MSKTQLYWKVRSFLTDNLGFRYNTPPFNTVKEVCIDKGFFFDKGTSSHQLTDFFDLVTSNLHSETLIRMGGDGDGGYLLPDDLQDLKFCFSPGVAENASFEQEFSSRTGAKVFLADASVDSAPVSGSDFKFIKKYLGFSDYGKYITLDSWMSKYVDSDSEGLLQMDIEGFEYEVLLSLSERRLRQFRIIVIEFHDLHGLFSKQGYSLISSAFQKLLQHFYIVHLHPNNASPIMRRDHWASPNLMELTFLRKDRVQERKSELTLPHYLDQKNVNELEDLETPSCWTNKYAN